MHSKYYYHVQWQEAVPDRDFTDTLDYLHDLSSCEDFDAKVSGGGEAAKVRVLAANGWKKRVRPALGETASAILTPDGAPAPRGMVCMTWRDYHRE